MKSKSIFLKRPINEGAPSNEDFDIVESDVNVDSLSDGEIAVQVKYMSVDPYVLFGCKGIDEKSNALPKLMEGFVSGIVLESKSEQWISGDLFGCSLPLSTVQVVTSEKLANMWKLSGLIEEKNLSWGIGVMGMPGSTAYAGLCGVLRPEKEKMETIFISAASGAVGSIAAQIAKNHFGCKTIGTAGGPEKVKLCKERYSYDVAIDYKEVNTKESLVEKLAAEGGIDMYFENVGSYQFDAAFQTLKPAGRIAVCGQIANYTSNDSSGNKVDLMKMIYTGQRIEGFVCFSWLVGRKGNFLKDMSEWIKEGVVKNIDETFHDNIESWPTAFRSLFTEDSKKNKGKVVIRV